MIQTFWGWGIKAMGLSLGWNRCLLAICPLSQRHPWRLRHYPPSYSEQHWLWWVKLIQWNVRLELACTPWQCCRHTKMTCSKILMKAMRWTLKIYIKEPCQAADVSIWATKEMARAIGHSMAMERNLWLNLSDIKEKVRYFLLDTPLMPSGLLGNAVNYVIVSVRFLRVRLLRAGLFGEKRCTPHCAVPVSLQCPREIGLVTLPPSVFQGTAVSSELSSQCPPRNIATLGGLHPWRMSLEQSDQSSLPVIYFRQPDWLLRLLSRDWFP